MGRRFPQHTIGAQKLCYLINLIQVPMTSSILYDYQARRSAPKPCGSSERGWFRFSMFCSSSDLKASISRRVMARFHIN